MKNALIVIAAIVGILLIGLCLVQAPRNGAISLEESVNSARSGIDVQLSNRFNKLSELTECVKQYDRHEYETLSAVISARGKNMSGRDFKATMASINAVAEQYPALMSQQNYKILMTEVALTENHLAQHKKAYNESVREYRYLCRKFPSAFFLSLTGYETRHYDMYEADESVGDAKPLKLF